MNDPRSARLQRAREELLRSLRAEIQDRRVLEAIACVPRELFVSPDLVYAAYEDRALPIGHGQTISQPLIVAMMTEALELEGDEKVLEVGTGSGYQAALLARLAREVITVERVPELAEGARRLLARLGYGNVRVLPAGEGLGCPEEAPFDAIVVTAGAPAVPPELVEQLRIGGRLVIPVGSRWLQELVQVTRTQDGHTTRFLGECRFVPLIGRGAWPEAEPASGVFAADDRR